MTIRIYPSRLPGEPLETHEHGDTTIHQWMTENVSGYGPDKPQRVIFEVNRRAVPPGEWVLCYIRPDTDVKVYPIPGGDPVTWAVVAAVVISVASAAYSIVMMSKLGKGASTATGDQLNLNPAQANTAKLGDPIREIFGQYRVYPDYLVQPVSRFDTSDPQIYRTEMFLSIGVGNFSISSAGIKIGNTPISSFGDDATFTLYAPGADVSGDSRADNWYNSTEVGGTTSGTSGLDLASTGSDKVSISADAITVSGNTITLIGETASDDDDDDTAAETDTKVPDSWVSGTVLTVIVPDSFTVATESGHTRIYGDFTELAPYVGMPVSVEWSSFDYDLYIASYDKGTTAVPGVGGNAASVTASAAPTTYDFSSSALSFTLTWSGVSYIISLSANYTTMSGLVDTITDQLTGSGLIAQDNSGRLEIVEPTSPFSGNAIGYTVLPSAIFGAAPVVVSGTASSGGTPEVLPSVTLAYGSATGTLFNGMPTGTQRVAFGPKGNQYQITGVDGLTITVERIIEVAATTTTASTTKVDADWLGFTERTLLDATVTGVNDSYTWMGPFLCCPDGETTTEVEINFIYPQGLVDIGSKDGAWHYHEVQITIQYRLSGDTDWTSVTIVHGNTTVNEIGYTNVITLPSAGNYEFRMKRDTPVWGGTTRDSVQWQAMRARLSKRPDSYKNITTLGVTIRTGNRLASQSDRRVSVVANRLYDGYTSRSISGALNHLLADTGAQVDTDAISALETNYWTPRGETFDFSADTDSTSMLDIMQKIATAGMGYFHLSDGLATVGREGIKSWSGVISPQETTEELTTTFKAPSSDDYDGVDVTYVNSTTWAQETVQCRTADNPTPSKVESYQLDGVVTEDRAYRIGMRRLMKYTYQRLSFSLSTELDALCYRFGDRLILTDDIPGSNTISCLVTDMSYTSDLITIGVSEPLDWTFTNPRIVIRYQDGSASTLLTPTQIDDFTFSIPYSTDISPETWEMSMGAIEPPRVIFCSSESVGYDSLVSEIAPESDGTCQVTATAYDERFYQHDDDTYPGDVS